MTFTELLLRLTSTAPEVPRSLITTLPLLLRYSLWPINLLWNLFTSTTVLLLHVVLPDCPITPPVKLAGRARKSEVAPAREATIAQASLMFWSVTFSVVWSLAYVSCDSAQRTDLLAPTLNTYPGLAALEALELITLFRTLLPVWLSVRQMYSV